MGWIPVQSFSLGSTTPKAAADCIEESAGYEGEWVTLVNRSAISGQSIKYRRRGRMVYETRKEAAAGSTHSNQTKD
jgi:hypothetical protein